MSLCETRSVGKRRETPTQQHRRLFTSFCGPFIRNRKASNRPADGLVRCTRRRRRTVPSLHLLPPTSRRLTGASPAPAASCTSPPPTPRPATRRPAARTAAGARWTRAARRPPCPRGSARAARCGWVGRPVRSAGGGVASAHARARRSALRPLRSSQAALTRRAAPGAAVGSGRGRGRGQARLVPPPLWRQRRAQVDEHPVHPGNRPHGS